MINLRFEVTNAAAAKKKIDGASENFLERLNVKLLYMAPKSLSVKASLEPIIVGGHRIS
jgi:hypothetical protein